MEKDLKKADRIKKYADVFEAYVLLDQYKEKHPSIEEATERLALLKARAKKIPQLDGESEQQKLEETVSKIDHTELKIKNFSGDVLPQLEQSMQKWINERIESIAESPEEIEKVKTFFENGGRDEESFHAIFEDIDAHTPPVKETKIDMLFAKIIGSLDGLIKEINLVLDSIDSALSEIENTLPSVVLSEPAVVVNNTQDLTAENLLSPANVESPATVDEKIHEPAAHGVKLSMNDLMQISETVKREAEGGVVSSVGDGSEEPTELGEMASLFNTFNSNPAPKSAVAGMRH
ncbi:MAG: hypothetical protein PHT07_10650 [Paludibacter sp.]|nr:hypothetical protein [Paludibacter sp.]